MSLLHPHAPAATRTAWRQGHRGASVLSRTPAPLSPASTSIGQVVTAIGVLCAVLVVALRVGAPDLLDRASLAVGVGGILIGIPHGAVDHLVPFWATGRRLSLGGLVRVLVAYLAVAALAIAALVVAPTATFVVFLGASAWHFGQAEVEFAAERRASLVGRSRRTDRLRTAAHGLTVVVAPLAIWPGRVHDVLEPLSPALAGHGAHAVFVAVAVGVAGLDLALLVVDLTSGRHREAAELALLVVLMTTVPPLAAFAVYFGAWHALRHTARLLTLPGAGGVPLSAGAAVRRYCLHATPPTVVVVVALGAVATTGSRTVITSTLLVLVALTFPHMRTVAALDRRRRVPADPALTRVTRTNG